jgi:hypothetical protein
MVGAAECSVQNDTGLTRIAHAYCVQRTGLCAGGEIEFRLPGTAAD